MSKPAATINTTPIMALLLLNLIGIVAVIGILLTKKDEPKPEAISKEVLVDRMGNIALDNGRVKFDLISLDGGTATVQQNVSLPQEGFVRGYQSLEQFMAQLIDKGYVVEGDE